MEKKEKIRIVITGCIHGNLEKMYSEILKNNKEKNRFNNMYRRFFNV